MIFWKINHDNIYLYLPLRLVLKSRIYHGTLPFQNENRIQTKVHSFTAGMKVEVIHPKRPSIICPARISKSLGPFHYQVTTEPLPNLPAHVFYGKSESTGIFSIGWSVKHGIDLALPACE